MPPLPALLVAAALWLYSLWITLRELVALPAAGLAAAARKPPLPGVPSAVFHVGGGGHRRFQNRQRRVAHSGGLWAALVRTPIQRAEAVLKELAAEADRYEKNPTTGVYIMDYGVGNLFLSEAPTLPSAAATNERSTLLSARWGTSDVSDALREAGTGLVSRMKHTSRNAPGYHSLVAYLRSCGISGSSRDDIVLLDSALRSVVLRSEYDANRAAVL